MFFYLGANKVIGTYYNSGVIVFIVTKMCKKYRLPMSSCKTKLNELNIYFAVTIDSRRGKYNQNFQKSAGTKM